VLLEQPPPVDAHPEPATLAMIYVIVPVHNRRALVRSFLHCMERQTFKDFAVIVVDDGSTDGTATMIRDEFPDVDVLLGDGNLWWTGAINVGIRRAIAQANADDAVLIINDDLEFDPGYLAALHSSWRSTPNTLIGSVIVDIRQPERIYRGGERLNWWTAKSSFLNTDKMLCEFGKNYQVDVSLLTGMGTLIPVQFFQEAGLFDDVHFQQCGDTELPGRARKHGYRLVVCYDAVVKVHVDDTAGINASNRYSLSDIWSYLFDIKSDFRLKYRFYFAYNTAKNPLSFVIFLICDIARITVHFLRGLYNSW
jgi:N-acetylglucosaminyl-diphospho-decaprenol L-rhamnosyltransferase